MNCNIHVLAAVLIFNLQTCSWPVYEMCGNTSREVTPPFYIGTSTQNHSTCSCDIYTSKDFLYVMKSALGFNLGNTLTIGNSTHKQNFIGGRNDPVLNWKLGPLSKVSVAVVANEQKKLVDILVKVKGTAKKVQLNCHGVKTGKDFEMPLMTVNISNDSTKCHGRFIGILFASGFFAGCFAITLTVGCVAMRKRKSSHKSSTVTYTKNSDETGTGDDSQRRTNEIVRPAPNQQDAGADESDKKDEDVKHPSIFPYRLSSDGSVSAQRKSAISDKCSLDVDCEESSSCQQNMAESAYDLACYPKAPPRAKGKRKCIKVPEESSETDKTLERHETVVVVEL